MYGHQPFGSDYPSREESSLKIEPGLGTLCAEAQADGVPCPAPDARCGEWPRALPQRPDSPGEDGRRPERPGAGAADRPMRPAE